jgi:hypothetical protein
VVPALFALLLPALAQAAPNTPCCAYPPLPFVGRSVSDFAPSGWEIEAQTRGVLDAGGRKAAALVLRRALGPTVARDGEGDDQRILAVLLETPAHGFALAAQNHTLIPSLPPEQRKSIAIALGDPPRTPGLEIRRGSLRLRLNVVFSSGPTAGRDMIYSLRLKGGRLYLIGYDEFVVGYGLGTRSSSYDYLSGKSRISRGVDCAGRADVVAHCRYKDSWTRLKTPGPLPLEEVGDGLAFTPRTD